MKVSLPNWVSSKAQVGALAHPDSRSTLLRSCPQSAMSLMPRQLLTRSSSGKSGTGNSKLSLRKRARATIALGREITMMMSRPRAAVHLWTRRRMVFYPHQLCLSRRYSLGHERVGDAGTVTELGIVVSLRGRTPSVAPLALESSCRLHVLWPMHRPRPPIRFERGSHDAVRMTKREGCVH